MKHKPALYDTSTVDPMHSAVMASLSYFS